MLRGTGTIRHEREEGRTSFPKGFLWGGATAANQHEGGHLSGGKGPAVADALTGGDGRAGIPRRFVCELPDGTREEFGGTREEIPAGARAIIDPDAYHPSHVATDFCHRWEGDLGPMAEMGFKVFRMSISRTRTFPAGDDAEQCRYHLFPGSAHAVRRGHEVDPGNKIGLMIAHGGSHHSAGVCAARPEEHGAADGTGEMRERYGFVYVDMDDDGNGDLSRSRKDSFCYMQRVYKSNGEDLD